MPNEFILTLDTLGPANASINIDGGATIVADEYVDVYLSTTDGDTTGYEMKIWGDVNLENENIQDTELNSSWITLESPKQIRLSANDGSKTISAKIRDDVHNESAIVNVTIDLDTTLPVVTRTSGPDRTGMSEQEGCNTVIFSFQSDSEFDEYEVRASSASMPTHESGVQIPTTNGSINVYGNEGNYPASTNITVTLKASDIKAVVPGEGSKYIKVFVKDNAGNWSAV